MRQKQIVLPEFGKDKPYLINLPNADASDLAAWLVSFCSGDGPKMAAVILEALREYRAQHAQVY
jgi:hypothetical protein